MSKSRGNGVNPFFALDRFGVDVMRYYLAVDGGIQDDADYDNLYIIERYKKDLQHGLGNLLSRIVRGKGWNVQEAVQTVAKNQELSKGILTEEHKQRLIEIPDLVTKKMEELDPGAALKDIMRVILKVRIKRGSD